MKKVLLGNTGIEVPAIVTGCMRLSGMSAEDMNTFIHHSIDGGAYFFDHADIYGSGMSEEVFGNAFSADASLKREDVIIQSKCGIKNSAQYPHYDLSKDAIIASVEGSLKRLKTDYLDILLLHRPDALTEPEEVAAAFDELSNSGKVKMFGVSNHNPMQIELLQKYVKHPLVANQLQFSIPVSNMVAAGMEVNMTSSGSYDRDGSVLDYCRLKDMTIQAWSPFQMPEWRGCFIDSPEYPELNAVMDELAAKYGTTKTGIATAWILRHPANMQVITGTTSCSRLDEIINACDIQLQKDEWYRLYLSAGHILP